jgi:hypothetical protein
MLILLHKERTENEIMQPLQSLLTALANKYEEELQINEVSIIDRNKLFSVNLWINRKKF